MMRVLWAFLRRAWIESTTEATTAVLGTVSFLLAMASQLFLGRLVDASHNPALGAYAGRYAAFLIVGIAILDVQHAVVTGLSTRIRESQRQGTFEAMLATPTPAAMILAGVAASDVAWALVRLCLYVLLGVMFFQIDLGAVSWLAAGVTFVVTMMAFAALGLLGGALTMFLRRGNPIALIIGSSSVIAGGVFYPRSVLPGFLAQLGGALPITPALEALRATVVHGASLGDVSASLVRLSLFFVFGGALGVVSFARALKEARKEGSLTTW